MGETSEAYMEAARLEGLNTEGSVFFDMAEFDKKYGFNTVQMTPQFLGFRMRFLVEELFEGIKAISEGRPADFVDAMIDLIVVAAGTLSIGKVDGQEAWDEVRRANMSKVRRANPTRPGSEGADLVKPDGWVAPNHHGNVGQFDEIAGWQFDDHFPYSVQVLFEAMQEQFKKYEDYDHNVKRGEYWIHGISSLEYEMNKKMLRFRSVLAQLKLGQQPNFESEQDSLVNNINYHSFAVALLRGREPGQDSNTNIFNEPEQRSLVDKLQERMYAEADLRETVRQIENECKDDMCNLRHLPGHTVEDHDRLASAKK